MELFTDLALCCYYGFDIYLDRFGSYFAACTFIIAAFLFLGKIFNGRSFKK